MVKNFFYRRWAGKWLVKCSQALSNWIRKSSLFCFCRMFVASWPKDLFLSKKGQFTDYSLELSSIDTAWNFSREHWWDLITFESILFLESLIVSLCLKYLVQSSKWRFELGIWEVVFFGLRLSFYLSVPDIDFLLYLHLFCSIWSYWE